MLKYQRPAVLALFVALFAITLSAKTTFSSVWKAPDAERTLLGGLKVAAVVIDQDESLRVSGEEALADELTKRGWTLRQNASEISGLHGIVVRPTQLEGGADTRREGVAKPYTARQTAPAR